MECNCCVMLPIMHQDKKLPHTVHLTRNQEWIWITTFLCSAQQRPSSVYLEETEEDKLMEVFVLKHCAGVLSRPLVFCTSVDPQLCKCFTLLHVLHHIQSTSFNLCHFKTLQAGLPFNTFTCGIHLYASMCCVLLLWLSQLLIDIE